MNFYKELETAITTHDIEEKEQIIKKLLEYCNKVEHISSDFTPKDFEYPSYAPICKIVPPKELPRRRNFQTKEGLALMLHSIVHIEYSAIDLALDAVYRFPQMPVDYKIDWLVVADDEVRHFRMLLDILTSLGAKYGDFPVHSGLFEASIHTAGDVLDRMAIIPRHYEATGLDVNPKIIAKLSQYKDSFAIKETLSALDIIYKEEIEHVKKGDRWFKYICQERGLDIQSSFFEILDKYELRKKSRNDLNVTARRKAGFSCSELKSLGAKECI